MRHLGAKEAADAIREAVSRDRSFHEDPTNQHRLNFVKAVCGELGVDPSPGNVMHVGTVLREHGVALHEGNEFPKFVINKLTGLPHTAHSAQEEDELTNGLAPKIDPLVEFDKEQAARAKEEAVIGNQQDTTEAANEEPKDEPAADPALKWPEAPKTEPEAPVVKTKPKRPV